MFAYLHCQSYYSPKLLMTSVNQNCIPHNYNNKIFFYTCTKYKLSNPTWIPCVVCASP